jgi:hypothetical protein
LWQGGHKTSESTELCFARVVSRESLHIAILTAVVLNNLDVLSADVQLAYLNPPTKEKNYIIAGPEFGANAGQPHPCFVGAQFQRSQVAQPYGCDSPRCEF